MKALHSLLTYGLFFLVVIGTAHAQSQYGNLRIQKVVPAVANVDRPDADGDYPAYIELRAVETSNVTGAHLSDSPNFPGKWQIKQAQLVLAGGQTMIIFASGKDRSTGEELHTNFVYDCLVPFCGLYGSNRELVDSYNDRLDRCACDGLTLIRERAKAQYLIPTGQVDSKWVLPGFMPGPNEPWKPGATGVGYDAGENPLCDGLVLYATMDRADISGTTVKDVSGPTVHDGTFMDGTSLPNNPAKVKEGLQFLCDSTAFVNFEKHPELDPGQGKDFAVAIWVKATSSQPSTQVIVSNGGWNSSGWAIYKDVTGTIAAFPRTVVRLVTVAGTAYHAPLPPLPVGEWHHVAFVVRGGAAAPSLQGYFDGAPVGEPVPLAAGEDFSSSSNLVLGRDLTGEFEYCGEADDFAIWGRPLSSAEVGQVHAAGNQGLSFKDPASGMGNNLYGPLINTDVEAEMRGKNATALVRVPFYLSSFPTSANKMLLRMRYDDGFQAYLNGVPVASRRAPSSLNWDSKALSDRFDPMALNRETIDISAHIGALRQGLNVLAIHGLNADADAERFLVLPELCVELRPPRDPGGQDERCVKSTNGTEFWLAFPENFEEEPGYPPQPSLCIAGPPGTNGTVELPGLNVRGFPRTFTIPPGNDTIECVVIKLPKEIELEGADDIEKKAVFVKADNPISVYGQNRIDYSTDSYLGLPLHCLGTRYRVLTYKNVQSDAPLIQGTQMAVVAPYDGTEVTITPQKTVGSHAAGVPFTINLDRGETYQLRNNGDSPVDVTGTEIVANKPVAVYGSHRCANIQSATQFFCDFLVEQLFPLQIWGRRYLVAPLETRSGDTLRILSGADNTAIAIDEDGSVTNINLDAGEVHDMTLTKPTTIVGERPVLVAQFSNSWDFDKVAGNLADPFMVLIQPADEWLMDYHISTPPKAEIGKSYVTIIAPNSTVYNATRIVGNGFAPLALGPPTGLFNTGEIYRRIELPASSGDCYRVYSTRGPIALTVYGFDVFDSYGYPGGLCIPDKEPPLIVHPGQITSPTTGQQTVPDVIASSHFADNVTSAGEMTITQNPSTQTTVGAGTHLIKLTATDGNGNVAETEVTFVVPGANTAPRSLGLPSQSVLVNSAEGGIDLTVGFTDAEDGSEGLRYRVVGVTGDKDILKSWGVDNRTKELILRCRLNLLGSVDILIRATDSGGLSVTGSQMLTVTGTPYQRWLNERFARTKLTKPELQVQDWGEKGDGDRDGNSTIGEAYHGGNPESYDEIPMDSVSFDAARGEYVFSWKAAFPSNGVEAECRWSPNLTTWYESGTGPPGDARIVTVIDGEIQGNQRCYEARIPGATSERIFFRLAYKRARS